MKLKYFLPVLALAATAVSCNYLNLSDPNSVTVGNYYTSEADIQQSVNGVYAVLKDGNVYGTSASYYQGCKARLYSYPDTGVGGGENASYYSCTVQASSSINLSHWNALYKCIDRANVVLKHLDDVKYANANSKDSYEAEVRFCRALCYYNLVADYGAVPLVLKKLETLGEVNEANVRVPKDQVYQAIFDDCEFVVKSPLADLNQTVAACGKANKVAAYTLWAKAALQMATDEDFSSKKAALCQTAITQLNNAWGKKSFSKLEDLPIGDAFDVANQETAKENIFQLVFIGGSNSANSSYNTQFRPTTIYDPNKEINADKSAGSFHMGITTGKKIWDEAGDKRWDDFMGEGNYKGAETCYPLKYRDLDASKFYGCNYVVFRYADVALMLAEAYYHSNQAGDACTWLNMVRNRAGLGKVNLSGTALRDAIYKERKREFAFEFMEWNDMKRGYTKAELNTLMQADGATEYSDTDYLLPIPYTQHILNPEKLYQNPGYASAI